MYRWFAFAVRIFIGGLFIASGLFKIFAPPQEFFAMVLEYRILPYILAKPFAYALPWAELIAGTMLFFGIFSRISASAIAGMLVLFITALSIAIFSGNELENCGCFGSFKVGETPEDILVRDIGLLAAALFLAFCPSKLLSLDARLR